MFGASVDISGDILVVGAGFGTGALYVYDVSTPSSPQLKGGGPIIRSDEAVSGFTGDIGFGKYGLAISGATVVVGASGADPGGKTNAGAAYMFDLSPLFEATPGAAVETKILASDGLAGDAFGHSVDIDGDIAIVGAVSVDDEVDDTITSVGAAYLFDTAGNELAELASDEPGYRYNFGHSVGISGDTAVVGEWTRYSGEAGHTAVPATVQLFDVSDPGTPTPIQKITSPNESHDYYAEHLAIDGSAILVGAKRADRTPTAARSGAYLIIGPPIVTPATGDVDGDGDVDLADVGYFEAQFGASGLPLPPGENSADLDADGDVDLDDLVFIRDGFGYVTPAAPSAATPEPATMTVLAIGGMLVLRRRRKD